ncbi:MAG: hypothetical protein QW632_03950 [Ignisphaera sp.]
MRRLLTALYIALVALFYVPMSPAFSNLLYRANVMGLFIYWTALTAVCIVIGFVLLEKGLRGVARK